MVVDIADVKRLGSLADTVRGLKIPKVVIDHHIPSDEPPSDNILAGHHRVRDGRADLRPRGNAGARDHSGDRQRAVRRGPHGYRRLSVQQHERAMPGGGESASGRGSRARGDVSAIVCIAAGRPFAPAARRAGDARGRSGVRNLMDLSRGGRCGRIRIEVGGSRGNRRASAVGGGTRLAVFFRDLGHGKIKVSFRSTGAVNVNDFARQFGGGGHARAAGALIPGTMEEVRHNVIAAAREFVGAVASVLKWLLAGLPAAFSGPFGSIAPWVSLGSRAPGGGGA